MQSIMKANGDVIKQWELRAVRGADRALNALVFNLCRRLAAGARVQGGRYDIEVESFNLGKKLDLTDLERVNSGPVGGYEGLDIETVAKVAHSEKIYARARRRREQAAKQAAVRRTKKAGARQ